MYVYSYFVWNSGCKQLIPLDLLFWQHFPCFVFAAKSICEKKATIEMTCKQMCKPTYLLFNPLNTQVLAENSFPSNDSDSHKIALAAVSKTSPVYPSTWFAYFGKEFQKLAFVYIVHLHKHSVPVSDRTQSVFIIRMIFVVWKNGRFYRKKKW
jgi:hypothetical protein